MIEIKYIYVTPVFQRSCVAHYKAQKVLLLNNFTETILKIRSLCSGFMIAVTGAITSSNKIIN